MDASGKQHLFYKQHCLLFCFRKSTDAAAGGKSVRCRKRHDCSHMVNEWVQYWSVFQRRYKCARGVLTLHMSFSLKQQIPVNACSILDCALSFRDGSLLMHKESPPSKNPFLEDLDKLDVSNLKLKLNWPPATFAFYQPRRYSEKSEDRFYWWRPDITTWYKHLHIIK